MVVPLVLVVCEVVEVGYEPVQRSLLWNILGHNLGRGFADIVQFDSPMTRSSEPKYLALLALVKVGLRGKVLRGILETQWLIDVRLLDQLGL